MPGGNVLTGVVHLTCHGGTVELSAVGEIYVGPHGTVVHLLRRAKVVHHPGLWRLLRALVQLPEGVELPKGRRT